ncbi:MAG: glycerophosphodiester phosphodiesterase [Psychromonas sp.]|nr:glycerophosphodiester phosphodiesterase [Psychromonas sp.]
MMKIMMKIMIAVTLSVPLLSVYAKSIDIYAHRGFRAIAPENTLPAYSDALKIGVDVVDMDVNMTKDGVLVVTHNLGLDPDLTKDKNGAWIKKRVAIKDLTLKQVKSYTVGYIKPGSGLAKRYPHHIGIPDVTIPTLLEVIKYIHAVVGDRVRFQIEMKTNPNKPKFSVTPIKMAKALNHIIKETGIVDQAEVQAFQWQALIDLKRLNPKIKTAFLTDHTTTPNSPADEKIIGDGYAWTSPLKASDYNYDYPEMVQKLGGTFWEPYEPDLTKERFDEAHKLGLKVVTWGWSEQEGTDFNYEVVEKLISWGVDGIITDRPDILRGVFAANGLILPPAYPNTPQ